MFAGNIYTSTVYLYLCCLIEIDQYRQEVVVVVAALLCSTLPWPWLKPAKGW